MQINPEHVILYVCQQTLTIIMEKKTLSIGQLFNRHIDTIIDITISYYKDDCINLCKHVDKSTNNDNTIARVLFRESIQQNHLRILYFISNLIIIRKYVQSASDNQELKWTAISREGPQKTRQESFKKMYYYCFRLRKLAKSVSFPGELETPANYNIPMYKQYAARRYYCCCYYCTTHSCLLLFSSLIL